MHRGRKILVFLLIFLCASIGLAQTKDNSAEALFSPSISSTFQEISYDLSHSEEANAVELKRALIFLNASFKLNGKPDSALSDLVRIVSQLPDEDYFFEVRNLLVKYTDESADFVVFRNGLQYLLGRLNTREKREVLVDEIRRSITNKNAALESELLTMLGGWAIERADFNNAVNIFSYAYSLDPYNKKAFINLSQLVSGQIEESANLERLRLAIIENPMDLEAAVEFAQYAENLQIFELAADSYEYCGQLFEYLYPNKPLPSWIYLPWALSNYNAQWNIHKCLQITKQVRESGRFDLFLEAVALKTANKVGDTQTSDEILRVINKKIEQPDSNAIPLNSEHIAWFYCFGLPDADKALFWANKAYSKDPNSPMAASLLGYALGINNQIQLAKTLIENGKKNQIADLALANIQISDSNKDTGIETLKKAISMDPASLAAQKAQEVLKQHGGTYVKPFDSAVIMQNMEKSFGAGISPKFLPPEKRLSLELSFRGSKFAYGLALDGSLIVRNISAEPLVITDGSLITGWIRVDANITGDINEKIPNLFSIHVQPTSPVNPGQSLIIPLRLMERKFKELLLSHPQASLDIELTAYIDPVITDKGVSNRLVDLKPAVTVIKRPGVEISGKYLQNRFDSLKKGNQGAVVQASELFVGLLLEQNIMAKREYPPYKIVRADWMPTMLKSAIVNGLNKSDWIGRVQIMSSLRPLPLDYELADEVSKVLQDEYWPDRLMALYLLGKSQGEQFYKVLDWAGEYDSSDSVREMAVALGGKAPKVQPKPLEAAVDANAAGVVDANTADISKVKGISIPTDANKPIIKDVNQRITGN